MKYLVSSTVATLCVFGATGVYYVGDTGIEEEPETTLEVEAVINEKMTKATDVASVQSPFLSKYV